MVGRNCGWCIHPDLPKWEARLAAGEGISAVAAVTPFSESAARRHVRLHLQPRLAQERFDPAAAVTVADFASRLLGLADTAATMRQRAALSNDNRLALQAIEQESKILSALSARLGIESSEAVALLEECQAVIRGVARAISSGSLRDAETLAWFVREEGAERVADALVDRAAQELRRIDSSPTPAPTHP